MTLPLPAERAQEYNNLRMQTLLETVTAQRNDAQNACANLTADKAVLARVLNDTVEVNTGLKEANANLVQQVTDLTSALNEAHEALRNQSPIKETEDSNGKTT
jgi:hypothetical protein